MRRIPQDDRRDKSFVRFVRLWPLRNGPSAVTGPAGPGKGGSITQFEGVPVKTLSAFPKVFLRSKGRKKEVFLLMERKGRKRLVEVRFP